MDLIPVRDDRRGHGPTEHEQVTFIRSALTGIQVTRTPLVIEGRVSVHASAATGQAAQLTA